MAGGTLEVWVERVSQCTCLWWARVAASVCLPHGVSRDGGGSTHPLTLLTGWCGLVRQSRAGIASLGSQVTTRCSSVAGLGELVLGAGVHVSQLDAKCEDSGACGSPGMSHDRWRDKLVFEALVQTVHQRQTGNSFRCPEDAEAPVLSKGKGLG